MASALFYFFAFFAVLFSVMVVTLAHPVPAALSLVASFFCASALFVLLNAPFLGVIQILIYVGAIVVLFLYVFMLLDLRAEGRSVGLIGRLNRTIALGVLPVAVAFLLPSLDLPGGSAAVVEGEKFGSLASVGRALLGPYALVFELISLVLLAAMIGAVVLGHRGKEESR
ncbi:MAG: NADH-quinone oxidoreductase subunit J [Pseudomonadota bacterium]